MQRIFGCVACVLCVVFLITGCGDDRPQISVVPVKGTVQLDGKEMAEGEIGFALPGEAAVISEIKNGAYSGTAGIGENRVEIRSYRQGEKVQMGDQTFGGEKENFIPAKYNTASTLKASVTESGPNEFNFEVTSQ
jgi:hypothetical protein